MKYKQKDVVMDILIFSDSEKQSRSFNDGVKEHHVLPPIFHSILERALNVTIVITTKTSHRSHRPTLALALSFFLASPSARASSAAT
jgi:hypothetical protein